VDTEEEEEGDGGFGFMLTAEELNRCSKDSDVIDNDVRPLLYICSFFLIEG
jgi:hypothetical protein